MCATITFFSLLVVAQCTLPVHSCPSLCTCDRDRIDCICPDGDEELDLPVITDSDVRAIRVDNCGNVTVPTFMATNLELEEVSFTNLAFLNIEHLAFFYASGIGYLQMRNVANLALDKYTLFGLNNVSKIELRNVNIGSVPPGTSAVDISAEEVVIVDSHLGSVGSFAFRLLNVGTFRMSNTQVEHLHPGSFYVDNVTLLEFYNDTFLDAEEASFDLNDVGTFNVSECHFLQVHSEAMAGRGIRHFVFEGNHVDSIGKNAFWNLLVTSQIRVADNAFSNSESDSLAFNVTPGAYIEFWNNSFVCDCRMSWLWEGRTRSKYSDLLDTSYCFGPHELKGAALLNVTAVFADDSCTGLVLVSTAMPAQSLNATASSNAEMVKTPPGSHHWLLALTSWMYYLYLMSSATSNNV